jgi:hypothetical protein
MMMKMMKIGLLIILVITTDENVSYFTFEDIASCVDLSLFEAVSIQCCRATFN